MFLSANRCPLRRNMRLLVPVMRRMNMRTRIIAMGLAAGVGALAIAAVLSTRSVAQNPMGDADAEPAPFNPQMAALMSMLIQPRHAKLGLAGKAENWPLAGYA